MKKAADKKHPEAIALYARILLDEKNYDEARKYLENSANTTDEGKIQLERLNKLAPKR